MDHGQLVQKAWRITWNNKFLWALGFLAALSAGGGSGGGGTNFQFDSSGELPPFMREGPLADLIESGDPSALGPLVGVVAVIACLLFILFLLLWLVSIAARAGLIVAVDDIENGGKSSFGAALRAGAAYIVRLILLNISLGLLFVLTIGVLIGIPIAVIAVSAARGDGGLGALGGLGIVLLCLIICLLLPLILVLQYVQAYAFRGIVLQQMGVIASIRHGWQIFRANLGDSLILGLIFGLISLVFGFAVLLLLAPLALIFAGPLITLFTQGTLTTAAIVGLVIGAVLFVIATAALSSIVTAFQSTGFTLAYRGFAGIAPFDAPLPKEKGPKDVDFGDLI